MKTWKDSGLTRGTDLYKSSGVQGAVINLFATCFLYQEKFLGKKKSSNPLGVFSSWAVCDCGIRYLAYRVSYLLQMLQGADLIVFPTEFAFVAWAKHYKIQMEVYSLFCIHLTEADVAIDFIVIEKANCSGCRGRKLVFMHVHFLSLFSKLQASLEVTNYIQFDFSLINLF